MSHGRSKTSTASKVMGRRALLRQAAAWRRRGERIILTNGCFDVFHVGHVRYLEGAKALGGRVIVGVNADATVRRLKGAGRPAMPATERAQMVAALAAVDAVVVFPEADVRALVRALRPDIHAKGTDYTRRSVPERDAVAACGGRVAIVGDRKRHSSTALLRALRRSRR